MTHSISSEDDEFRRQFESGAFPKSEFKHRQHLRLAYIYLAQYDENLAHQAMRDSIQNYLKYHSVCPSVYNETITRAWILATRHFMETVRHSTSSDSFIDQYPIMLDSKIMMTHYSKDLLFSDGASNAFIEPDLAPIPRYA